MTPKIIDISEPLEPATAVWPGDSPFSQEWVMRIEDGMSCNVSTIRMSLHCGTHTDAPFHFFAQGKTIEKIPLETYIGPCRVLKGLPIGSPPLIDPEFLKKQNLKGVERLLIRTKTQHGKGKFNEDFCALGPAAAQVVVSLGIRLVGLDTPSMDSFSSKTLEAHKILLKGGVAILENLDLSKVVEGDFELVALPLKIMGGDSSPVRAILRPLPQKTQKAD
jgi:arylformamidase